MEKGAVKGRRRHTAEQKAELLRQHVAEKKPVSGCLINDLQQCRTDIVVSLIEPCGLNSTKTNSEGLSFRRPFGQGFAD